MKRTFLYFALFCSFVTFSCSIPAQGEEKTAPVHLSFLVDGVWLKCQEGEMLSSGSVITGVRMKTPVKLSFRLHFRRSVAGKSLEWWSRWGRADRNDALTAQEKHAFLVGMEIRSGLPVEYRFATKKKGWSDWKKSVPWNMLPERERKQENALIGAEFRYVKERHPEDPLPPKQFRKPSLPVKPSVPSAPVMP